MIGSMRLALAVLILAGGMAARAGAPLSATQEERLKEQTRLSVESVRLQAAGKLPEAVAAAEKALGIARAVHGDTHDLVALAHFWLARLHAQAGNFDAGRRSVRELLAVRTRLNGDKHWQTINARWNQSTIETLARLTPEQRDRYWQADRLMRQMFALKAQGQRREAITLARQVLELRRPLLGADHPEIASALNSLGILSEVQKDYPAARRFYEQAVTMRQRLFAPDRCPEGHPDLAATLDALSSLLRVQAEYATAEGYLRQAVAQWRKLYPKDRYADGASPLASSINRLGLVRYEQGDPTGAVAHLREAVAMWRKLHPGGHDDLAAGLMNLGAALKTVGNYPAAEACLREALALRRRLLPPIDGRLALTLDHLGSLLRRRGDQSAAEECVREALAIRQKLYPSADNPRLADSLAHLASILQDRGDYAQSEDLFRAALAMSRRLYPTDAYPNGHPELAACLSNLGNLLRSLGDFAGAEENLREALPIQRKFYPREHYRNGHPDLAATLNNLGVVLSRRGDHAQAEKVLRESLAMWRGLYPPRDHPSGHAQIAETLNNLGDALHARGDYTAADECLREGLAMRERLYPPDDYPRGHSSLVFALNNRGRVLHERGDHIAAEGYARRAVAMARKLYPEGHPLLATCLDSLGGVLWERGDLHRAKPYFLEALALRRKWYAPPRYPDGHIELTKSLSNVGGVYRDLQQYRGAETHLRQAVAMYRKLYPLARDPNASPLLATYLSNLGSLLVRNEEYAEAEKLFREALQLRRKFSPAGHPELAIALSALGGLLRDRGEYAEAATQLREALAMWRKLYPPRDYPNGHPHLSTALTNLGMLLHERGERAEAQTHLRQAGEMQQRLLDTFLTGASETEGLLFFASMPFPRDAYLSATHGKGVSAQEAYGAVWASRAALARWVQARRQALLLAREPALRELEREWAATRQALACLLLAPAGSRPDQAEQVRTVAARKEKLEKELAERLPAFRALRERTPAAPGDLVRRLPEGAVFIDLLRYIRFEQDADRPGRAGRRRTPSYVAFILAKGQPIHRVELGPANVIDEAVAAWRQALSRGDTGDSAPALLREKLWQPLETALPAGTRAVLLVPDGELTRLPWAALPGRRPGSILLEDYALAVTPYGQFLLDCLSTPSRDDRGKGQLLAVGDVAFSRRPAPLLAANTEKGLSRIDSLLGERRPWLALPGTAGELERVTKLARPRRVEILRGANASTARLLADLPKARWAHLATHGFFADREVRSVLRLNEQDYERGQRGERVGMGARNPLVLSGLVLAGANLKAKDPEQDDRGILTAEAIAGLDLDGLDLAVLSACETGLGEVAGGEGVFGLQRAFHGAGARSVVASLWKVDDGATQELMGLFYENLWHKGLPKLEALRQAQLALLRGQSSGDGRTRAPDLKGIGAGQGKGTARAGAHLWAAWVLSGDPGDLSTIRPVSAAPDSPRAEAAPAAGQPRSRRYWLDLTVGGVLGGILLALVWVMWRRRAR
jgi:tetratricopeptide (TPR) repeat protein/CHAT domain-containing protein